MNEIGLKPEGRELGHTPYSKYVQTEALHTLQEFVSDSPAEPAFLANVQISEIYWALIVRELVSAQAELRRDRVAATNRILRRIVSHMEAFNANWRSLSWLTPAELMPILKGLAQKHGKDTALQGWTFREMVFLLGVKDRPSLEHFEPQPLRLKQLQDRLNAPSLYDDVLAALARAGKPVPRSHLQPSYAAPYVHDGAVEAIWAEIYSMDDPTDPWRDLAELLADIAVEFTNWKYLHLMATRRTFGGRPAYHGEDAIQWLLPTMDEIPFPEVWTARSKVI
ncbi:tryptophan 2,3-dioxygenase family protein [Rhizobiaceae bacterium n13]|uniref:Tryptophan 2,3-dioxygenase family protein n=1 Tax=Ferirhizobium litorale TaxID=2927786 RepID=A0AAE3QB42_9HYPH|nr:tryptophan 2,3-dioxygenase family protein [Fererhizobium litorale]MDI7864832.1 tryptophan 2,3-dioxygenase family protein [Fererhizobium litorale]MDI7921760.1 tryptophan 2,3-dioxygenase family protein [Fererhizobium litorale]